MTERIPPPPHMTPAAGPHLPDPADYTGDPFQAADLSALTWSTPDDPSSPVSRACERINAAIKANLNCTAGHFSRLICVGTPEGLHGKPALAALIDADPHSLIDHWYGLAGHWNGPGQGPVAGIIRLPMIDAPDIETLIERIQHARAQTIQRPRAYERQDGDPCEATQRLCGLDDKSDIGSRLQFLRPVEHPDPVFCHNGNFNQAVTALEQMIRTHDRELRRSPLVWWTNRHPGDRLVDHLSRIRPGIKTPHFWPTLPWEWPYAYSDGDQTNPQDVHPLIDVLAACPDRERSVFTRPRIRFANRRGNCPEMLVFAGRRKKGRNWIYGRIEVRKTGNFAGIIRMPAFLDGVRNLDLFDLIRKDAGQVQGLVARKDPPEEIRSALEAQLSEKLSEQFGGKPLPDTFSKTGTGAMP